MPSNNQFSRKNPLTSLPNKKNGRRRRRISQISVGRHALQQTRARTRTNIFPTIPDSTGNNRKLPSATNRSAEQKLERNNFVQSSFKRNKFTQSNVKGKDLMRSKFIQSKLRNIVRMKERNVCFEGIAKTVRQMSHYDATLF